MPLITLLQMCTPAGSTGAVDGAVGLGVFLLIGLFGGAHCLGMCGPLVTTYTERMQTQSGAAGDSRSVSRGDRLSVEMVRQHGLFNLGRTVSYALLGGLFGLAGSVVSVSVRQASTLYRELNIVVGFTIGVLIIGAGLHYLFRGHVPSLPGESLFGRLTRVVHRQLTDRIDTYVDGPGIVALGALHGLLPCPLLYPAFLYAFAQASPVGGMAALAVLGVGTIPSLFLYGTLFGSLSLPTRRRLHRVLGIAFVLLGYIPLQHALMLMGIDLPHAPVPFYQPL